ncbi:MAG TPA: DUF2092 domain-containing protein [Gaiellaceae bacterium]|nr:DUF2092 domain-containing protein [Gaiellaceae bacterium]
MRRFALVLLAVPLVLVACGGSKKTVSTSSALSAVEAAAVKTVQAGSSHVSLTASAAASGQNISLTGNGAFDTKSRRGMMHVDLSAGTLTAALDEVLVGTSAYIRSPLLTAALPPGKKWLKIDLAKAGKAAGFNLSLLASQDPGQALSYLRSLKSVTVVGKETVGGSSTTHYHGVASGSTYDAWVGDDGYVHQVRVVTTAGAKVTATTVLSDFGTAVKVTVPPAAQSYATNSIPGLGG